LRSNKILRQVKKSCKQNITIFTITENLKQTQYNYYFYTIRASIYVGHMNLNDDDDDVRWKQRFSNYKNALAQLTLFIEKKELNILEKQGLIKSFEYTYELAWNTLKDYLEYQGISGLIGSRDTIRASFKEGLIEDGAIWMNMIESRNRTSHTYNEDIANEIEQKIMINYFPEYQNLQIMLSKK
jgi:nucleotidyltransferase substrate binding protein (TIGR01987 family)